ncbi:MAG: cytidine deaminase [Nocardioidaceae bacterium]|nr:cytidine deaminase [Nocardioidaceae bacterium]
MSQPTDSPEDVKILTLARTTRARVGAPEGAAVRDTTGRTYTAATVELDSLRISALGLAVAMAVSSGADGVEAAAVATEASAVTDTDLAAVRDLGGSDVRVFLADPAGRPQQVVTT